MSDEERVVVVPEDERLRDCGIALQQMHLDGKLDNDSLYASLLKLARDWVAIDHKQTARDLVSQVSEEYLTVKMPVKMRAEPEFHRIVHELACGLSEDISKVDDSDIDLAILRGPIAQA